MVADAITKCSSQAWARLQRFLAASEWRIVDDPNFTSSTKRKEMQLDDLDNIGADDNVGAIGWLLSCVSENVLGKLVRNTAQRFWHRP